MIASLLLVAAPAAMVQGKAVATLYDLMGREMHVLQLEQTPLNYISTSNIKTGITCCTLNIREVLLTKKYL